VSSKNKKQSMFSLKLYLLRKAEKKLKQAEAKKAKQHQE
jgi:hypothetical protein